jgi:hypothetical protein
MAGQMENRTSAPRQAAKGFDGRLVRLAAGLTAADLLLICAGAATKTSPLIVLLAHVALLAAFAGYFPPAGSADRTPWTFSLMLILIAGPLGALGIALLGLAESRKGPRQDVLEAWYDRLSGEGETDPALRLHEDFVTGRGFKPARVGPRSFVAVMEKGTLADRQTLLGHIGLKYHRDYFPVLSAALRSPQSAVRAQAAAVFVKLKEQFRLRLSQHRRGGLAAENNDDVPAMLACARSIVDCAESGFLDSSEAREALAEAKALCLNAASRDAAGLDQDILYRIVAASGEDDGSLDLLLAAAPASCSQTRQLVARCLVATGRHMELHKLLFAPADRAHIGKQWRPLASVGGR